MSRVLSWIRTYSCTRFPHEQERSTQAVALIERLMERSALHSSTQVLQEFYVISTRKIQKPITPAEAVAFLERIAEYPVHVTDFRTIREAIEVCTSQQLSFWDALIIVAASRAGADILYSEDLQHGRVIRGVKIVNPFRKMA